MRNLVGKFINFPIINTLIHFVLLVFVQTGYFGQVWTYILFACIFLGWFLFFYIFFKKRPGKIIDSKTTSALKIAAYPKWARTIALIGIVIMPLISLVWPAWRFIKQTTPPEGLTIMVARFDGPERDYGVTAIILENLTKIAAKYADVRILPLGKTITREQGAEVARELGHANKANIVLWGWYIGTRSTAQVNVHFQVINGPKYLVDDDVAIQLISNIDNLENFKMQFQISRDVRYLAFLSLGLTHFESGRYSEAVELLSDAINEHKVSSKIMFNIATVHNFRGCSLYFLHEYQAAIADYNEATRIEPENAGFYRDRAMVFFKLEKYGRAMTDVDQAIGLNPDDALAYMNRGVIHRAMGNIDLAISNYKKAIGVPSNLNLEIVYFNLGNAHRAKGDSALALQSYGKAIELNPNYAEAYNRMAIILMQQRRYQDALKNFNVAIQIRPRKASYYLHRSQVYEKLNNDDRALPDLNETIKLDSLLTDAYRLRARVYSRQHNFDAAIADFDRTIVDKPDDPGLYILRGASYLNKGEYQAARNDLDFAVSLDSAQALVYFFSGIISFLEGEYKEVIEDVNKVTALQLGGELDSLGITPSFKPKMSFGGSGYELEIKELPSKAIPYYIRGMSYFKIGIVDSAIIDLKRTIELAPNNPQIRLFVGEIYMATGKNAEAIAEFTQAIQEDSTDAQLYNSLGVAYLRMEDFQKAIGYFSRAIEMDNAFVLAYSNRGEIYAHLKQFEKAIMDLKEVLKTDPSNSAVMNNLAWTYAELDSNLNEARQLSATSVKLDSTNPYHWGTFAEILFRLSSFKEARVANGEALRYATDEQHIETIRERAAKLEKRILP